MYKIFILIYLLLFGLSLAWINNNSGTIVFEILHLRIHTSVFLFCLLILTIILLIIILGYILKCIMKMLHTTYRIKNIHLEKLEELVLMFLAGELEQCTQIIHDIEKFFPDNTEIKLIKSYLSDNSKDKIKIYKQLLLQEKSKTLGILLLTKEFYRKKNYQESFAYYQQLNKLKYQISDHSLLASIKIDYMINHNQLIQAKELLQIIIEKGDYNQDIINLYIKNNFKIIENHINNQEYDIACELLSQNTKLDNQIDFINKYYEICKIMKNHNMYCEIIKSLYKKYINKDDSKAHELILHILQQSHSHTEIKKIADIIINIDERHYLADFLKFYILKLENKKLLSFQQLEYLIKKKPDINFLLLAINLSIELKDFDLCQKITNNQYFQEYISSIIKNNSNELLKINS